MKSVIAKGSGSLGRKTHLLGTKVRNLRKRNNLTLDDLSSRCIRLNAEYAPSVSYLSMIERGKRVPSLDMLEVIAQVFQKEANWFLDDVPEQDDIVIDKGTHGGIPGMPLEPSFLFSNDILQIAIPEMLSQTGISGRQFAHLLIRAHQEHHQNHFPDLEKAAEEIGQKRMPLAPDELIMLARQQGLTIKWFSILPRGFAGLKSVLVTGLNQYSVMQGGNNQKLQSSQINTQDILQAWRDFEASFFAGALLCPKVPFRQLLDRNGYEIATHEKVGVSASVAMRRMTAVSPYKHWHYFDAYAPGKLKAVYRGNGIPLPWGNMREVADPCQHWAVFRMINTPVKGTSAQLSILNVGNEPRIYCCESTNVVDLAQNKHVLCSGIDLNPAINAQGGDAQAIAHEIKNLCVKGGGSAQLPVAMKKKLQTVARILNINWVERGVLTDPRLICSRGAECPREPSCYEGDDNVISSTYIA
jgi:transcriptional regulator with XRE-family HTH domain